MWSLVRFGAVIYRFACETFEARLANPAVPTAARPTTRPAQRTSPDLLADGQLKSCRSLPVGAVSRKSEKRTFSPARVGVQHIGPTR